eukprot:TRINITY_DN1285_c0_g2_i1.p1 TRINITY_DN1285_c0_g2~~TRINITY_DN1285_c0_g2_i1.p1  ORF type:complete len:127 (+),score=4.08 TRINITY_DN1285_c0_g2_i1:72-452(+)
MPQQSTQEAIVGDIIKTISFRITRSLYKSLDERFDEVTTTVKIFAICFCFPLFLITLVLDLVFMILFFAWGLVFFILYSIVTLGTLCCCLNIKSGTDWLNRGCSYSFCVNRHKDPPTFGCCGCCHV